MKVQASASNAWLIAAFMNSATSITASSTRQVSDLRTRISVASNLVYDQTSKTATNITAVSATPRHVRCCRRWVESCETAKTKTRSKRISSGETSSCSVGCAGGIPHCGDNRP